MSVIIVAGGTGGHINAALSLGSSIKEEVHFYSGKRHLDYKLFKTVPTTHINAKPLMIKNPFKLLMYLSINTYEFVRLTLKFMFKRPKYAIGCGGYVCGPVLAAAYVCRVPCYIIEQNAVMGLTNRLLSSVARKIFVHFKNTVGLSEKNKVKVIVAGNPIRQSIEYTTPSNSDVVNILVFGGSLGASQINEQVEKLVQGGFARKISIKHQVGKESKSVSLKNGENIQNYERVEYIEDMGAAYKWSHVIISRAGASSISELKVVQRPTLLIPYPLATHNHQEINAQLFSKQVPFFVSILNHRLGADELFLKLSKELEQACREIKSFENVVHENAVEKILNEINYG